jgi:hypothetical protein
LQHLVFQLGDLLFLRLDLSLAFLSLFLIGSEGGTVGFEFALVRDQFLFDFGDVLG